MTIEKLEILLKDIIEEGKYIYKTYEDKDYIYVFTKLKTLKGIDYDDRYAIVGGLGPILVDKQTKEFKRIHFMDVPSELHKKYYVEPTIDSIAKGIIKRQYVNKGDMLSFVEIYYKGERDEYFDYGKVFYDYKFEKEFIKVNFKIKELRDKFISFLEVLNVKCKVEDDGWLVITRVPEQS
ncbi:hypothetical protein C8N26_1981 [Tenacibaculum lutimaris]|uniref:Uncharacterized protein n=1 Tax=Tenacibaculum lutimaris TaxID=285258 RepID=A0A420E0G0_9FLAO|nr:hypothetical protein [Tenacibaculum lutimaris]RKF03591.1 hypothetical protein C8N26_1981 [Tenacibaculum lutimaris]